MSKAKFEITGPLYSQEKKISNPLLKTGDRFIYKGHASLLFKTDAKPISGKYLCCNEEGRIEWIDGNEKVNRINGIVMLLNYYSKQFKEEYFNQEKARQKKV